MRASKKRTVKIIRINKSLYKVSVFRGNFDKAVAFVKKTSGL